MRNAIQIRAAKPADAPVISRFNARLATETEARRLRSGRLRAGVAAVLADPARGQYYVAVVSGQVVGQVLVTFEWSDWRNGNFWWLQSVYVEKGLRGRGVFRALFRHVRRLARGRKDVCGLRLYVAGANRVAKRVYHQAGFRPTRYEVFEMDFD
ncbi:MAG: GNAT family N-acetyltransferase [Verrucomicrobia bacterium]|nr:GNAT family N-acetyltransferase [Verrucomicrobiota bacterium]